MTELVQLLVDGLSLGSLYALMALGIALIFGVVHLVNFAYAEVVTVAAYAALVAAALPWPLVLAVAVLGGIAMSVITDRIAFRPVRGGTATTVLVTSFVAGYLVQNLAFATVGSRPRSVPIPAWMVASVPVGPVSVPVYNVATVVITAAAVAGLSVYLRHSRTGLAMRAAAEDPGMVRLLGVRADRVVLTAFVWSGALGGLASFVLLSQTGVVTPHTGLQPALVAFVATVIGGMGSLVGAAVGGLLVGMASTTFQTLLPLPLRDAFVFVLVVAVLLWRPDGLFSGRVAVDRA
jgi:branched-chain amino acid transport system permease protein